jgi:hypothetical protein
MKTRLRIAYLIFATFVAMGIYCTAVILIAIAEL